MKQFIVFFILVFSLSGCKEEAIKKPKDLIEKKVMVDILYDLSLLEASKYQNLGKIGNKKVSPSQFIYNKYKTDSIQVLKSNMYYASNIEAYKAMFDEIGTRLNAKNKEIEAVVKAKSKIKQAASKRASDSISRQTKQIR